MSAASLRILVHSGGQALGRFLRVALAAVTAVGVFGTPAFSLPEVSCKDAWSRLIHHGDHRYDYDRDARSTERGNEGYEAYQNRLAEAVPRSECYKEWTVLVFMAADNNLEPYAFWDLYEMEAGNRSGRNDLASSLRSDLLVELDTAQSAGIRRMHMMQTEQPYDETLELSHFEAMAPSDVASPIVSWREDEGETPAHSLASFLKWGMEKYPAKNYMVVVWGHGQGWTGRPPGEELPEGRYLGKDDIPRFGDENESKATGADREDDSVFSGRSFGGLAFDDSQETYLDIPTLRSVLDEVTGEVLGGEKIDLYVSDACLMQMLEVATEVAPVAKYVVGSAQVQNFLGLPYRTLMRAINRRDFDSPSGVDQESVSEPYLLAYTIPELMRASLNPRGGGLQSRLAPEAIEKITMSSLASAPLQKSLLPAFGELSADLAAYLKEEPLRAMDLRYAMQNAPSFQGGAQEAGAFLTLLKIMLRNQREIEGGLTPVSKRLKTTVSQTRQILDRTVMNYALGTNYDAQRLRELGVRGVSVWMPMAEEEYDSARMRDFQTSRFYEEAVDPREPSITWKTWIDQSFKTASP